MKSLGVAIRVLGVGAVVTAIACGDRPEQAKLDAAPRLSLQACAMAVGSSCGPGDPGYYTPDQYSQVEADVGASTAGEKDTAGCTGLQFLSCTSRGNCCDKHDACYAMHGCSGTFSQWSHAIACAAGLVVCDACDDCNNAVVACIIAGSGSDGAAADCCARGDCGDGYFRDGVCTEADGACGGSAYQTLFGGGTGGVEMCVTGAGGAVCRMYY
jgi:hypothetical protein